MSSDVSKTTKLGPAAQKIAEGLKAAAEGRYQIHETSADWDAGFDAGYKAALGLAVATCNERSSKHQQRGTRLAKDYQSEASACAFAIQKKADQKSDARRVASGKR